MQQQVMLIPYSLLAGWLIFSIIYLIYSFLNTARANPYLVSAIPSVFTTLGVFGTFIGIAVGLDKFDVNDINNSIPTLLDGLKTAFYTSIIGIGLSLIFSRIIEIFQKKFVSADSILSSETKAINELITEIREMKKLISSDDSSSLNMQLVKVREAIRDEIRPVASELGQLKNNLGGDEETSLLSQTRLFRTENYEQLHRNQELLKKANAELAAVHAAVNNPTSGTLSAQMDRLIHLTNEDTERNAKYLDEIQTTMEKNRDLMVEEFEKFSELLAKNNTEILVEAIENVIGNFNEKLNELLGRLVKENFEQLNESVQKLNQWQIENANMVDRLVSQFEKVVDDFEKSSTYIKSISSSTEKLTNEDGKLVALIKELEQVLLEENKFVASIQQLHNVTSSYESTWDKANRWMEKHKDFAGSVEKLIDSLQEIEELRSETDGFFDDIKEKLSENIGILEGGNRNLMDRVNTLESSFQDRMNISFRSLDKILQSMVTGYADRLNGVR